MTIDTKALRMEQVTEVAAKLFVCTEILTSIEPLLTRKLEIDEDILQDFSLAKSRLDYLAEHIRREQLKLRKT